jgi:hypothetical protein
MALARVVSFKGVGSEHMNEMTRRMQEGEQPEGLPATEVVILHDPAGEKSLAILFFDNEDDYRQGDATLDAMPAPDIPGRRTAVTKYNVDVRMTT